MGREQLVGHILLEPHMERVQREECQHHNSHLVQHREQQQEWQLEQGLLAYWLDNKMESIREQNMFVGMGQGSEVV